MCRPRHVRITPIKMLIFIFIYIATMFYISRKTFSNKFDNYLDVQKRPKFLLSKTNSRLEFGKMMESLNFKKMILIGVRSGEFAQSLLSEWPSFEKFYGIDAYKHQILPYFDTSNKNDTEQDVIFQEAKNILSKYGNRTELIRKTSFNAASQFNEKSIDFIYIDSKYDFCSVYQDLTLYYPKLNCGGIIAGNKYVDSIEVTRNNWSVCTNGSTVLLNGGGTKGAVLEFTKVHHVNLNEITQTDDTHHKSFYFSKRC